MRTVAIFFVVGYVVYKFFRLFFGGISSAKSGYNENSNRKSEPNVHKPQNKEGKDGKNYQGGEYVEYEEVD